MEVFSLNSLPIGYRFRPTDEELVNHFLRLKIGGHDSKVSCIREVDICKNEPWDLPGLSRIESKDNEWFFFCRKDQKYMNGQRSARATKSGYWKPTGKDRTISKGGTEIGKKKTLVFHSGRAPKGVRTCWVIHEYVPTQAELDGTHPGQNPFVICRLFKKEEDDEGFASKADVSSQKQPSSTNNKGKDNVDEIDLPKEISPFSEVEKDLDDFWNQPLLVRRSRTQRKRRVIKEDFEMQDEYNDEVVHMREVLKCEKFFPIASDVASTMNGDFDAVCNLEIGGRESLLRAMRKVFGCVGLSKFFNF